MTATMDSVQNQRFTTPDRYGKYISRYDISSAELQNLQQANPDVIEVRTFDLSTAQNPLNPVVLSVPGRGVAFYGLTTAQVYDPKAVTGIEDPAPQAFMHCRINNNRAESGISLKHNRGFRGSFLQLHLSWPAQAGLTGRIYVFKYDDVPWMGDTGLTPSNNTFTTGQKAVATAGTAVQLTSTATPISSVVIKALKGNGSAKIYVGSASGNLSTTGFELNLQESVTVVINDLSKIWIDSDTNGSGVSYTAS